MASKDNPAASPAQQQQQRQPPLAAAAAAAASQSSYVDDFVAQSPPSAGSPAHNPNPKQQAQLARVRDNQRRSRARRKEYLHELEEKARRWEQAGKQASAEMQAAARKVLDENNKLKVLLRQKGVSEDELNSYINPVEAGGPSSAAAQGVGSAAEGLEHLLNTGRPPRLVASQTAPPDAQHPSPRLGTQAPPIERRPSQARVQPHSTATTALPILPSINTPSVYQTSESVHSPSVYTSSTNVPYGTGYPQYVQLYGLDQNGHPIPHPVADVPMQQQHMFMHQPPQAASGYTELTQPQFVPLPQPNPYLHTQQPGGLSHSQLRRGSSSEATSPTFYAGAAGGGEGYESGSSQADPADLLPFELEQQFQRMVQHHPHTALRRGSQATSHAEVGTEEGASTKTEPSDESSGAAVSRYRT